MEGDCNIYQNVGDIPGFIWARRLDYYITWRGYHLERWFWFSNMKIRMVENERKSMLFWRYSLKCSSFIRSFCGSCWLFKFGFFEKFDYFNFSVIQMSLNSSSLVATPSGSTSESHPLRYTSIFDCKEKTVNQVAILKLYFFFRKHNIPLRQTS